VNSTAHTVAELGIQFRELITCVNTSLRYIPDSSSLHNIPDDKFLDSFVLGHAFSTVSATDRLYMASTVLITPIISPFGCHSLVEVNQAILAWSPPLNFYCVSNLVMHYLYKLQCVFSNVSLFST